jgi:hypothetical protein
MMQHRDEGSKKSPAAKNQITKSQTPSNHTLTATHYEQTTYYHALFNNTLPRLTQTRQLPLPRHHIQMHCSALHRVRPAKGDVSVYSPAGDLQLLRAAQTM